MESLPPTPPDANTTVGRPAGRAVPLAGVVAACGLMLGLGLALGYAGRPLVAGWLEPSPTPTATPAPPTPTLEPPASATQRAQLMEYVIANTRHFRGNPAAPVTLIEFSDFQ